MKTKNKTLYIAFVICLTASAWGGQGDPNTVVAEVLGRKITEAELFQSIGADLYQLESRVYQLKQSKLDELIGQILLEKEAAKRKMTSAELLEKYVQKRVGSVSKKEINKFYEENKQHLKGTKEQYEERIKGFLDQEKYRKEYDKYLEGLKKSARAKIFLSKPERHRITLNLTPGPSKGGDKAKVELVEFSDFECPFCSKMTETLEKVARKYGQKIKVTFKAFPLSRHQNAPLAHQASLCANDQKKFWPFHDALFKNNRNLVRADLEKYATDLRLDMDKFRRCLDSGEKVAQVQKELSEGEAAGVRSTPTLFVNGQMVVGAVPQEEIESIINEELKRN